MYKSLILILYCAFALFALAPASAITIDTVPIGKPGNANDPASGNLYGGVAYNYAIGKYDVTVGQYTVFLNAVAATDTFGLYNSAMATDLNIAGISQSCVAGSCSYGVIGSANHPITYISWGDAARFANWLQNGQPVGPEGAGTTEAGAYTLNGATTEPALNAISRNAGAKWFIPSESEWYKAAYYDPVAGHYWRWATGTNTVPTAAPPGNIPNTANYYDSVTGYAVTQTNIYDPNQNYLTDVGAYTASASPYGTFDQSGDVFQWNESLLRGSQVGSMSRGLRGGAWALDASYLRVQGSFDPTKGDEIIGFRVATVPEPTAAMLAVLGCGLFQAARACSLRRVALSRLRRRKTATVSRNSL
jgi:formylglycine-generating enzyme